MKKYFYLIATVVLSVSLFSACSDDDNEVDVKKNNEGYIIKEVTFDGNGATAATALAGGLETTIKGEGFSSASEIYVRPTSTVRAEGEVTLTDNVIKLAVKNPTATSITISTPFLYGTYELLQKEGTEIYTLGNIYFKEAKRLSRIVSTKTVDDIEQYVDVVFDSRNRIIKTTVNTETLDWSQIPPIPSGQFRVETVEYTYSADDNLSSVKKAEDDNVTGVINFSYNGNTITETKENFNDIIHTLDNGRLVESKEEFQAETGLKKTITKYSYDSAGNLTEVNIEEYNDGVLIEASKQTKYSATYGTSKSFLAPGAVPAWYHAAYPTIDLIISTGIMNQLEGIVIPGRPFDRVTSFTTEFDADLYPIKIVATDPGGVQELEYTIEYAQ